MELFNLDVLPLALIFLVPGFVAAKTYGLLVPPDCDGKGLHGWPQPLS